MSDRYPTSPLRILEESSRAGLGPGKLGVVMARAGVGKTTFLVGVGLELALSGRAVLHVSLDNTLEQTIAQYEALFEDLAHRTDIGDAYEARAQLGQRRVIQALRDRALTAERLQAVIDLYAGSMDLRPAALLIDGYDWEGEGDPIGRLGDYKGIAAKLGAELWMTARSHREQTPAQPTGLLPPCAGCAALIDLALFLDPAGQHVRLRYLKDHDAEKLPTAELELDPDTMRAPPMAPGESWMPRAFTLLSGGHAGAEAAFGEEAERWGVRERNFSFAGREPARQVALVELGDAALHEGEVSARFIETKLHRRFPETEQWRHLIDSIWHQVATAGQVFVIGQIQEDGTVRGGTGWAAELAKHFHKSLFVFDQSEERWRTWSADRWEDCAAPHIWNRRFCGTGTRSLSEAGRQAITALFERSFSGG